MFIKLYNDGDMGWEKFYTLGVLVNGVYVKKIINKNYADTMQNY